MVSPSVCAPLHNLELEPERFIDEDSHPNAILPHKWASGEVEVNGKSSAIVRPEVNTEIEY